jgi:hypothetical protein
MTYRGHIQNGQIVLDEPANLPDGSPVTVIVSNGTPVPQGAPTVWDALLDVAGTVEGLPPDMAENHDHYIHGTPKRK